MRPVLRFFFLMAIPLFLNGCATSGYKTFYEGYFDPSKYEDEVRTLGDSEEPEVFTSNNLERDVRIMRSRNYSVVGVSSFNGAYEDLANAKAQAKRVGATMVLVKSAYTDTQTHSTTLFLPDSQTTYYSGSAYGSGGYAYGSGTATTYGTKAVPVTSTQRRYDQTAVYFVPYKEKPRFGFQAAPLTPAQRRDLDRNTGVLMEVIIEDTPFFYSNVLPGDVLIEFYGQPVRSVDELMATLDQVPQDADTVDITVIRKGHEKEISVEM